VAGGTATGKIYGRGSGVKKCGAAAAIAAVPEAEGYRREINHTGRHHSRRRVSTIDVVAVVLKELIFHRRSVTGIAARHADIQGGSRRLDERGRGQAASAARRVTARRR